MIYNSLMDDNGNDCPDRTVIFVQVDSDGEITSITNAGKVAGVCCTGLTFVVDKYVADQIDKFYIAGRELILKDGKKISKPVKSKLDLEERELLKRLEEIKIERTQS